MSENSVFMPKKKEIKLDNGQTVLVRRLPIRAFRDASASLAGFLELLTIDDKENGPAFMKRLMAQGPEKLLEICVVGVEGLDREQLLDLDLQTVADLASEVLAENNVARILRDTIKKVMGQQETAA